MNIIEKLDAFLAVIHKNDHVLLGAGDQETWITYGDLAQLRADYDMLADVAEASLMELHPVTVDTLPPPKTLCLVALRDKFLGHYSTVLTPAYLSYRSDGFGALHPDEWVVQKFHWKHDVTPPRSFGPGGTAKLTEVVGWCHMPTKFTVRETT